MTNLELGWVFICVTFENLYLYSAHSVDSSSKFLVGLFELMLYIPVNSHGHVGTLPPFYGAFTRNEDVMTSNKCFTYNPTKLKPIRLIYGWFEMNHFTWADSDMSG